MPLYIFNCWDADEEESLIQAPPSSFARRGLWGRCHGRLLAGLASGEDATVVHSSQGTAGSQSGEKPSLWLWELGWN